MDQLAFFDERPELPDDLLYEPALFDASDCHAYLDKLIRHTPWEQRSVVMYGQEVLTPRLTAWFGDPDTNYSASGHESRPLPWTHDLLEIREKVETFCAIRFNSVLLNYYRDGRDSVSWHDDQDGIAGRNRLVGSVSFGAARVFDFRLKSDHAKKYSITLENGSFLLMRGNFQRDWQHRIAKSANACGPRINLTFRISNVKNTQ